ncbi:MAG: UDP-N-acetylmuramoyl-tripeptide--D-alanyl-D-alanine ligase [Actinobacteria bacterium]|nr:UDP-N-acetylmuramoyl-tripeptide--D-alanyl-D-alanine ligase [Actinomycetota bacterium]
MKALKLENVTEAVGGALEGPPALKVSRVGTDSRDFEGKDIFFALKGENFDGHVYLENVVSAGARVAVVEAGNRNIKSFRKKNSDFPLIIVKDTLRALGDLASYVRDTLDVTSVGITGTNGKTCTKDFLASILEREYRVCCSEGSYNNEIGTPLTVLKASTRDEVLICEMGARHPGDIERLAQIVKPDHGIITNIGPGHLEIFGDQETIARTKSEIGGSLPKDGRLYIKAGDKWTGYLLKRTDAKVIKFGYAKDATYKAVDIEVNGSGKPKFKITGPGLSVDAALPAAGRHNILNALAAVSCAREIGAGPGSIVKGLASAKLSKWRTQVEEAPGGYTIINDAYNANPQSMQAALETLSELGSKKRKIAVLGDMAELGESGPEFHFEAGRELARLDIDVLIVVGPNARNYIEGALKSGLPRGSVFRGADIERATQYLKEILEPGDIVLVKASRVMGMEKIVSKIINNGSSKKKTVANV